MTKTIARAIDENQHVELDEFILSFNIYTYKQQFAALDSSTFTKNVKILDIKITNVEWRRRHNRIFNFGDYSNTLVQTFKRMSDLHKLRIRTHEMREYNGPHILVNILQSVHHLEELEMDVLSIGKAIESTSTLTNGSEYQQLEVLKLNIRSHHHNKFYELGAANQSMESVLQSCPLLEEFKIEGEILMYRARELRFDFSHLKYLKSIKMEIEGECYYKLNIPGKKDGLWLDLETPYVENSGSTAFRGQTIIRGADLVIGLTWSLENAPSVTLLKAQ